MAVVERVLFASLLLVLSATFCKAESQDVVLNWVVDEQANTINIVLSSKADDTKWIGLGFGQQMAGSQTIVCWLNETTSEFLVAEYKMLSHDPENFETVTDGYLDTSVNMTGLMNDTIFTVGYSLKLDKLPLVDGKADIIWAIGDSWGSRPGWVNEHFQKSNPYINVAFKEPETTMPTTTNAKPTQASSNSASLDGVDLMWQLDPSQLDKMVLCVSTDTPQPSPFWIAVGFGTQMSDSDVILGWFNEKGEFQLEEYHLPTTKATDIRSISGAYVRRDVMTPTGYQSPHHVMFNVTVNSTALDISDSGDLNVVWAIGREWKQVPQHDNMHYRNSPNYFSVNLITGKVSDGDVPVLVIAHAFLMGISWLILAPTAVLVALYRDSIGPSWIKIHKGLNVTVVFFVIVALILIKQFDEEKEGEKEASNEDKHRMRRHEEEEEEEEMCTHEIVGIIAMGLLGLQVLFGFLRPAKEKDESTGQVTTLRKVWEGFHRVVACLCFLVAVFAYFLGFKEYGELTPEPPKFYIGISVAWLLVLCIVIVAKLVPRCLGQPTLADKEIKLMAVLDNDEDGLIQTDLLGDDEDILVNHR